MARHPSRVSALYYKTFVMEMTAEPGVAALVRSIRAARGLTQEALARELGVSFATVNGWENGRHRPIPALERQLVALAQHDGTPVPVVPPVVEPERSTPIEDLVARTGWPFAARERRDFYHRPREFPQDVQRWRARMVDRAMDDDLFPVGRRLGREAADRASAIEAIRPLVDDGISFLRELARIAALLHRTPDLGNKKDPVDELVYIILARKTREDAYQRAFDSLKQRFRTWDELLEAGRREVQQLLRSSGLGEKKTASLFGALGVLRERFGSCTLEPAREWPDEQLEELLVSLPELHRKSAYCIMLYAFGRSVFPVDTHVGRMLARLGPYRELGLELRGLDHKQLQRVLADLVPPNLRYSLHVNLLSHGRDVCRAVKPLCGECSLRNFCRDFREREAKRIADERRPKVVDLFTGAGGLSEGFYSTGFEIAAAVDNDPLALRTYWLNHPGVRDERVLCRDIRELADAEIRRLVGKRVDVLIGAPPCQGFSNVGHRSKSSKTGYRVTDDARNFLYAEMIRVAVALQPRLLLMENVPGMKSASEGSTSFLETAAAKLRKVGFATTTWSVNAASYGVPQDRRRVFLVAAKGVRLPELPTQTHQDLNSRTHDPDALPAVTFDEATTDLPQRRADEGFPVEIWEPEASVNASRDRRYLRRYDLKRPSRLLFNHTVRYHNERDLELYALLRPGEDSVHALERYGRSDLMRYRSDVFDDKYARLRPDRPCKTIVSHLAKDGNGYIHPSQVRSISIREAARVQSFHDEYVFCGAPTDQWIQVGNAVPPVLARAIAVSFMAALKTGKVRR
jgi:DNA (cytosine-5)-methyltransferase 1